MNQLVDLCGADLLSSLDNVANYDDTLIKGWDACDDAVVPNASEAITRSVVTDKPSGITCADNFVADIDDQDLISAADSIAPVPVTSTSSPISMEDLTYKQIELYGPPRPEAQVTIIDLMHKEFSIDPHGMIIDLTHKESSDDQDGPSISNADRRNERSPLRTKRIVAVVNPTINTTEELAELERKLSSKSQEIQEFASSITQTSKDLAIFAAVVPFIGIIVKTIYDAVYDSENVARMKALEAEMNDLRADAIYLTQKQWQLELQIFDWQMKIAKANFDRNSIPDPIHLNEVQSSLSKIQKILIRLKEFWEVAQMLKYLEQKTFVGEDFIEDLADLKDEFLESIEAAKEAWSSFGAACKKASRMFKLQTKDAYKFLEVSPEREYESVKEQLQKIDPVQSVMSSDTPAISE
ncbi:myosin heavy chain [Labeo rohita]|uniref:Myosin heavy chain n=1 Tax=Labeo rohita TaxID=84645 RepID=A0A498M7E7_LABRO|nr:myosin heavy chain [Labeo rohita]